jgi:riboflavin-specific deaminase-like protein
MVIRYLEVVLVVFVVSASCSSSVERVVEDSILRPLQEAMDVFQSDERPFVTVTYAQALDGSLAPPPQSEPAQQQLSGAESLVMTHALRAWHSAILVGAGTVEGDNPRLSVRHWPSDSHPLPVILAPRLNRLPAILNARNGVVFTDLSDPITRATLSARAGGGLPGQSVLVQCLRDEDGRCNLRHCLSELRHMGCRSVMVEGGADVIESFLAAGEGSESLVDRVIVTIAPMWLSGRRAAPSHMKLRDVRYVQLGDDIVAMGRPVHARAIKGRGLSTPG